MSVIVICLKLSGHQPYISANDVVMASMAKERNPIPGDVQNAIMTKAQRHVVCLTNANFHYR